MFDSGVTGRTRAKLEKAYALELGIPGFSFKDHSVKEVDDFNYQMRGAFSETGEQLRPLSKEEERFILDEMGLCSVSFLYWVERYAKILSDKKRVERMTMWVSQRKYVDLLSECERAQEGNGYVKIYIIALKARQLGISVVSEAIECWQACFFPNTRCILASDHEDNSQKMWAVFMRFYENLPLWMRPTSSISRYGEFFKLDKLGSELTVGQGNQLTTVGQGMTAEAIHFTELGAWKNPHMIDEDVLPAFNSSRAPLSIFMLESTGQGMGENWYYKEWQNAKEGNSFFKPIFLGWFLATDKYVLPAEGVLFSDSTEEMSFRVKEETGISLTPEQKAWYQKTRAHYEGKGELEKFLQEYPSSEIEAFQSGLRSIFPLSLTMDMRSRVKKPLAVFRVDPKTGILTATRDPGGTRIGLVTVWGLPEPGFTYVVGADPAYGVGRDNSAVFINKVGTRKTPDEQVAEYHGQVDAVDFSNILWKLGHLYTDKSSGLPALMAIEANPGSPGILTQEELRRRGYANLFVDTRLNAVEQKYVSKLGWHTTPSTRPLLTELGEKYLKDRDWVINSPAFIMEMNSFVDNSKPGGRRHLEHAPGAHDDLLFAGFIALYVSHDNGVLNIADERRKEREARGNKEPMEFRDWAATNGYTLEEALEEYETPWLGVL